METKLSIKEIEVFFFTDRCYRCGEEIGCYSVEKITTKDGTILKATPSMSFDNDLMFNDEIVRLIRLYLEDHPELNIKIGQIKKRFSNAIGDSYTSFGCPDCDALLGNWYLYEAYIEYNYDIEGNTITIRSDDYIGRNASIVIPFHKRQITTSQPNQLTNQSLTANLMTISLPSHCRFVYSLSHRYYVKVNNIVMGKRLLDDSLFELDITGNNLTRSKAEEIGHSYMLKNNLPCRDCYSCINRDSENCKSMMPFIFNHCNNYERDAKYVDSLCEIPTEITVKQIQ